MNFLENSRRGELAKRRLPRPCGKRKECTGLGAEAAGCPQVWARAVNMPMVCVYPDCPQA